MNAMVGGMVRVLWAGRIAIKLAVALVKAPRNGLLEYDALCDWLGAHWPRTDATGMPLPIEMPWSMRK